MAVEMDVAKMQRKPRCAESWDVGVIVAANARGECNASEEGTPAG